MVSLKDIYFSEKVKLNKNFAHDLIFLNQGAIFPGHSTNSYHISFKLNIRLCCCPNWSLLLLSVAYYCFQSPPTTYKQYACIMAGWSVKTIFVCRLIYELLNLDLQILFH